MPELVAIRRTIFCLSICILFALGSNKALSQNTVSIIDTTDYLPYPDGINTNLMIAASKGYTSEIHRLIKLGADINTKDLENVTPLMYAVANNNITTVNAILDYNPDTEALTNRGESALHIAAKENLIDIAEAIIRADADIDIRDPYEATPLHYAAAYGNFYICDLLLYYQAGIDIRADDGSTALMASVFAGHADICDLLIQSGSNPDIPDNKGYTAFIIAAQNNDTLLLDLLLKSGANIYAVNDYNYDALGMAIRNNNYEAYKYIINKIDRDKYQLSNSISPLIIARKYSRSEILQDLRELGFRETNKLDFDHVKIQAGFKTAFRDYYTRIGLSFKDPLWKLMINAGFELKPSYTKVLVKKSESSFYQYYDKRYIFYAGLGREFTIAEEPDAGIFSIDLNLNAGYMLASKYKGTNIKPPDQIRFMPQVLLRWNNGKINFYGGYEYMQADLYRIGPHWFTIGMSYDIYFDKSRSPNKTIRWY